MGLPFAHIGWIPIEEMLAWYGPAVLVAAGAASASVSARLHRLRGRRSR